MQALFLLFSNICRFKQGPDSVPSSTSLLLLIFVVNFFLESLLGLTVYSIGQSLFLALFAIFFLFAFTGIWLYLFRLTSRYLQTITALVGISLFTNIIFFLPLTLLWKLGLFSNDSFALLNLLLIFWVLTIYANIYRAALNISFFLGLALVITYFITFNTMAFNIIGA